MKCYINKNYLHNKTAFQSKADHIRTQYTDTLYAPPLGPLPHINHNCPTKLLYTLHCAQTRRLPGFIGFSLQWLVHKLLLCCLPAYSQV